LYDAFVSLSASPAEIESKPTASLPYEQRLSQQLEFDRLVEEAFLGLLQLRAQLAKSPMRYLYRFPTIGDKFDKVWMRPVQFDDGWIGDFNTTATTPAGSMVYVCLRPAIISLRRTENSREVVAAPALVVLEDVGAGRAD
jgi:hypothetical protein